MNEIIRSIESAQLRTDIPKFNVGDTVRVFVKNQCPSSYVAAD